MSTANAGTFHGAISFPTNDSDENPFNFAVTGTVAPPATTSVGIGASVLVAFDDPTATANTVYTVKRSVDADITSDRAAYDSA